MTKIQAMDDLEMGTKPYANGHQPVQNPTPLADKGIVDDFDYDSLLTEDDEPVDNIFSEKQQRLLTETLYTSRDDLPLTWPFLVLANVALYHHPKRAAIVPDVLLSLDVEPAEDVWQKQHRCYFVSQFGKLPEVVMEIVSNEKGGEVRKKMQLYEQICIPHYVIFDPQRILSQDALRVYQRDETTQRYQPLSSGWLPAVGLGLELWSGEFEGRQDVWLRWCDGDRRLIPTGQEKAAQERLAKEQAQQAEKIAQERAIEERQQKELAYQQVAAERQQKEQLIAQLKALGIEPKIDL